MSERRQRQFEFRMALGALRGFGLGNLFGCRFMPPDRTVQLRELLGMIEREVRANYRQYQASYGSECLAHPTKAWSERDWEDLERSDGEPQHDQT